MSLTGHVSRLLEGMRTADLLIEWALPRESSVGFVTGATVANFVGLAAARHALLARQGCDVEAKGLFDAPPFMY